jgi:hypothetical protein
MFPAITSRQGEADKHENVGENSRLVSQVTQDSHCLDERSEFVFCRRFDVRYFRVAYSLNYGQRRCSHFFSSG